MFKYLKILFVVGGLLFSTTVEAYTDSLRVRELIKLSLDFLNNEQYDSSKVYLAKAQVLAKQNDDLHSWLYGFRFLGYYWANKKEGYKTSLAYCDTAISDQWRFPQTGAEWKLSADVFIDRGHIFKNKIGNYKLALDDYEAAKDIYLKHLSGEKAYIAQYIYVPLGNFNTRLGDYKKALFYHNEAKEINLENKNFENAAKNYIDIGIAYRSMGDYKKAIASYENGLQLKPSDLYILGMLYVNMGLDLYHAQDYDLALEYTSNGVKLLEKLNHRQAQAYLINALNNYGLIHRTQNKYKISIDYFDQALKRAKKHYPNLYRREVAKLEIEKGYTFLAWEKHDQALAMFQQALQKVLPDFKPKNNFENPDPQSFYAENTIMEGLVAKAKVMEAIAAKNSKTSFYKKAIATYELVFRVEQRLNDIFDFNASRQEVLRESKSRIAKVIELCHTRWQADGNPEWVEKAFQFSEAGKARLLDYAIKQSDILNTLAASDTMISYEKALQLKLAKQEEQRFNILGGNRDEADGLSVFQDSIFKIRQEIKSIREQLESKYPAHYNWKIFYSPLTIKDIQKELETDQSLVEYFIEGQEHFYVFVINKKESYFTQLDDATDLDALVGKLRDGLYGYHTSNIQSNALYQEYNKIFANAAFQLYQKIIAPVKENLKSKITIIPDETLAYVPFEILLQKEAGFSTGSQRYQIGKFKNYPYLQEDHQISYCYSVNLLQTMRHRHYSTERKRFLGVAPSFPKRTQYITEKRGDLDTLYHNIPEVNEIQSIWGGNLLLNEAATKNSFCSIASDYAILHLATHGQANDSVGDFSYIAFTEVVDSIMNEFLYNRELYNLQLSADMVVLSACETGVGELQKGEGIISMARGFSYAGAKSIITTLWSVNDEVAPPIMKAFYQHLKDGLTKDAALREAKRDYLNDFSGQDLHPYYWAGFIGIGDMSNLETGFDWSWWILGMGLGGLFVLFFWRKRRNNRSFFKGTGH